MDTLSRVGESADFIKKKRCKKHFLQAEDFSTPKETQSAGVRLCPLCISQAEDRALDLIRVQLMLSIKL